MLDAFVIAILRKILAALELLLACFSNLFWGERVALGKSSVNWTSEIVS
jgi:hypothetical protein